MANLMMGETYLKQAGIVNDNVDMKLVTPVIKDVQVIYIRKLLGTRLYDQILSQIGSNSVSTANQTLLDNYVLPCMKYYVQLELTPILKYRYMNKGIMVNSSENGQPADLQEIKWMMDYWKNKAEVLAEKVTEFLKASSATYTLYYSNTEIYEDKPNTNNFTSGLYLEDPDEDCCNLDNP
jgi:hypothetical protein